MVGARAHRRRTDLLVHSAWLRERFPGPPGEDAGPDHYVVVDLKFTTKIDENSKAKDRQSYAAGALVFVHVGLPAGRDAEARFAGYA